MGGWNHLQRVLTAALAAAATYGVLPPGSGFAARNRLFSQTE